jgi:opacity protein-like surface antigen
MEKHAFLLLLLICFFLAGNSQKTPVEMGFQSGINFNSASKTSESNNVNSGLTGLHIGAGVKINIRKKFGLKAILSFDQNGWAYRSLLFENNTASGLATGDVLFKLKYLNLPVMAEYSFGNKIKYYLDAGIFLGLLLNNQTILKIKEPDGTVFQNKGSSNYHHFNFGMALAGGIKIPLLPRIKLDLGVENHTGLFKINSSSSPLKLNAFSILGGLSFKLKCSHGAKVKA